MRRILFALILAAVATPASASPITIAVITGCVSELPAEFSFEMIAHLEIGAWEDKAGCDPSSPQARPTGGPYNRYYGDGGLQGVTMRADQFNPFCSTQMDIRAVFLSGLRLYFDFIYNPPTADTAKCFASRNPLEGLGGGGFREEPETPPIPVPDVGSAWYLLAVGRKLGADAMIS